MGAEQFSVRSSGTNPEEAFRRATEEARYEHGHGGYTGTIAEKSSFKMVFPKDGESPRECIDRCLDDDDHFCQDKWGHAACVPLGPNPKVQGEFLYVFFGWASS